MLTSADITVAMVEVFAAWRQGHLQPVGNPETLPSTVLDARLARIEAMMDTALTYRSGDDKGGTKDVATSKQVGRIISMLEKLTSAETITLTPTEVPAFPNSNRTPLEEISFQIFMLVHNTDHDQRAARGRALGDLIRKTLQDIEIDGSAMLAAVNRMIEEAVKNSAAYEQAERYRLRAERAEGKLRRFASAAGEVLREQAVHIASDSKQPLLPAA